MGGEGINTVQLITRALGDLALVKGVSKETLPRVFTIRNLRIAEMGW